MSNISISEYRDIGSTARGSIPIPLEPPVAEQSIELGINSKQSKPFAPDTCIVKLIADADCAIAIGLDPDATKSVRHLAAGREQMITVIPNSKLKIAARSAGTNNMSDSLSAFLTVIADPAAAQKAMDGLKKQTAQLDAATKNLNTATAAASHAGTLTAWEKDLSQREKALAVYEAKLKAKDAAISELLA